MELRLIGNWTKPLSVKTHNSLIIQAVKRSGGCCQYCGVRMPMTATHPNGSLSVCVIDKESSIELDNLITLCAFCVNFNDIQNLVGKGTFVELPWLTQTDLTNILRIVYSVQSSNDPIVKSHYIYQGSGAILEALGRTPSAWSEFNFDGSVESVIKLIDESTGYFERKDVNEVLYLDRLRFFFHPSAFVEAIDFWRPTVEAQIIKSMSQ
jgi:hypothetical protein